MQLVLLIGLQASGKSTFFRTRFADNYEYVSKDLLRNNQKPARRQLQLIADALRAGRSVVVDNTNPTREEREELVRLGHSYGANVIGYFFEIQVKQSLERNKAREGKARVPDIGIFATLKKLTPPSYEEGFDQLYHVRPLGDQTFDTISQPAVEH